MLKRTIAISCLAGLLALNAVIFAADLAGEKKLQEAINLMESKGDVVRAAALFEEVSRSSDKSLAATALLYLARAQERQGIDRARATYERIARDFGQTEAGPRARERLNAMSGKTSASPALRPLIKDVDVLGSISSDGRSFAMVDWDNDGDLAIRDLMTGRMHRLFARSREDSDEFGEWVSISPNKSQLAFLWFTDNADGDYELRVMPNQPRSKAETLLQVKGEIGWIDWASWFPDGKSLLAVISKPNTPGGDGTWQLARIWLANRRMEVLKSLEWRLQDINSRPAISPNGQYIAYTAWATNPKAARTTPEAKDQFIYVLPVDGSGPESIVAGRSGINESPVWTPDGERIVFVSNRQIGNEPLAFNLWSVVVQNGKVVGSPSPSVRGTGRVHPKGMSDSAYYYVRSEGGVDIFTTVLDPVSLEARAPVTRVPQSNIDLSRSPSWSPDGKAIAFFRSRPRIPELNASLTPPPVDLVVQQFGADEGERAYPFTGLNTNCKPLWLDKENLLVLAGGNVNRVKLNSGVFAGVQSETHSALPRGVTVLDLSPDKRTLYVGTADIQTRSIGVYTYDLKAGNPKKIWTYTLPAKANPSLPRIGSLAVSPDGRYLAMTIARGAPFRLVRMEVTGEGEAELATDVAPMSVSWSRDGDSILFVQRNGRLAQVPRAGGSAELAAFDSDIAGPIDFHPDGSRVALTVNTRNSELWAIDNPAVIFRAVR